MVFMPSIALLMANRPSTWIPRRNVTSKESVRIKRALMLNFLNIKPEFFKVPILSIAPGCGTVQAAVIATSGNDNPFNVAMLR
jgi:hypothetical protein